MEVERVLSINETTPSHYPVLCMAYEKRGNFLYTGYKDGNIRQWDMLRGNVERVFYGHIGWVTGLLYSEEKRLLFSCSLDMKLCLWSVRGEVLDVRKVGSPLYCLEWNPLLGHLLIGSVGTIEIFYVEDPDVSRSDETSTGPTMTRVDSIESHFDIICGIKVANQRVITASYDGTISIRDAMFYTEIRVIRMCGGAISDLGILDEEKYFYSTNFQQELKIWTYDGEQVSSIRQIPDTIHKAVYSPSTDLVWLATKKRAPTVVDIKSKTVVTKNMATNFFPPEATNRGITCLQLLPTGFKSEEDERIVAGCANGFIIVWKYNVRACLAVIGGHSSPVEYIDFVVEPHELYPRLSLFSISTDGSLRNWNCPLDSIKNMRWKIHGEHRSSPSSMLIEPETGSIFVGCIDGNIVVWDTKTTFTSAAKKIPRKVLHRHTDSVNGMVWWNNSLISASNDSTIRFWSMERELPYKTMYNQEGDAISEEGFLGLALRPRGDQLATIEFSEEAKVWSIQRGMLVHTLKGHTGEIYSIKYLETADAWITNAQDQTIRIWSGTTGTCLQTMHLPEPVHDLFTPPDTDMLITCTLNNTLQAYEIKTSGKLTDFAQFSITEGSSKCLVYVRQLKTLLVGAEDGNIRTWRLDNPRDLKRVLKKGTFFSRRSKREEGQGRQEVGERPGTSRDGETTDRAPKFAFSRRVTTFLNEEGDKESSSSPSPFSPPFLSKGEKSQTSNKTTSPSSASLSSARKDVSPRKSRRVFENPQEVQPVSMEPPVKSEEEIKHREFFRKQPSFLESTQLRSTLSTRNIHKLLESEDQSAAQKLRLKRKETRQALLSSATIDESLCLRKKGGPDNPLPLLDEFFRQQEEREALAEQDRKSIQGGQRAASPGPGEKIKRPSRSAFAGYYDLDEVDRQISRQAQGRSNESDQKPLSTREALLMAKKRSQSREDIARKRRVTGDVLGMTFESDLLLTAADRTFLRSRTPETMKWMKTNQGVRRISAPL